MAQPKRLLCELLTGLCSIRSQEFALQQESVSRPHTHTGLIDAFVWCLNLHAMLHPTILYFANEYGFRS